MRRLLIDASSILRALHHVGQDVENGYVVEFDGKKVAVNSAGHAYENFIEQWKLILDKSGLRPFQTVLVLDGANSRALRQQIFPGYKAHRPPRPPELNKEFNEALEGVRDEVTALGGMVVWQDGMEADDVIAYLAQNLEDHKTIWCRDKDMLALVSDSVDVYYGSELNPWIHDSCPPQHVLLYKALCGDSSDGFKGAKGFGEKAFETLVTTFGAEGLQMMEELIRTRKLEDLAEDVPAMKELQKVIDDADGVYLSYACAQFYPQKVNLPSNPLQISMQIGQGSHELMAPWNQTKRLARPADAAWIISQLRRSPELVTLDIETSIPAEADAWVQAIIDASNGRKKNFVDVFGSELTGMSLTFGDNLQHTVYMPVDHQDCENWTADAVLDVVAEIPEGFKVAIHNTAFELPVLYNTWTAWVSGAWDTMLMKSYVDENTPLGLKDCSKQYFGYEQTTYEEVTGGRKMNELTAAQVLDYACDDTICTSALFLRCLFVMELEKTLDAFEKCELEAQYWVASCFVRGIDIDWNRLVEFSEDDRKTYEEKALEVRDYLLEQSWWQISDDSSLNKVQRITLQPYRFENRIDVERLRAENPGLLEQIEPLIQKVRWEGIDFIPVDPGTPAGIKEAFLRITGQPLNTRVRKLEKLVEEVRDGGAPELAELIESGNLEELNRILVEHHPGEPLFDSNKDADLRLLMYEVMGLPIRFRTNVTKAQRAKGVQQGTPQVDYAAVEHALKLDLEEGTPEHRCLLAIREMKACATREQLYYKPYPLFRHWKDGKIHPQLGQCRTATRRFAPNAPNINQLPKRKDGGRIRSVFKAPPGYIWASFDWSGQELRLAAERSGDEKLTACYVGDHLLNPHSLTAAGIALKEGFAELGDYETFLKEKAAKNEEALAYYAKGKAVNFSSQYLCRKAKLGKLLVIDPEEAQLYLDAKNETFWGLAQWQQDTIAQCHARGYAVTLMGGRRHLYDKLTSIDTWAVNEAERQGVNHEIQGSGAEMAKCSINAMHRNDALDDFGAWLVFPVHDEGDFLIPIKSAVPALMFIHSKMVQRYAGMEIPLESEMSIGPDFGTLTKVGEHPTPEAIEAVISKLSEEGKI